MTLHTRLLCGFGWPLLALAPARTVWGRIPPGPEVAGRCRPSRFGWAAGGVTSGRADLM